MILTRHGVYVLVLAEREACCQWSDFYLDAATKGARYNWVQWLIRSARYIVPALLNFGVKPTILVRANLVPGVSALNQSRHATSQFVGGSIRVEPSCNLRTKGPLLIPKLQCLMEMVPCVLVLWVTWTLWTDWSRAFCSVSIDNKWLCIYLV